MARSLPADQPLSKIERVTHAFHRLAYGARPGEVEAIARGGEPALQAWIRAQLHPENLGDSELDYHLKSLASLALSSQKMIEAYPNVETVAERMGIDREKLKGNEDLKKEIREKIGKEKLPAQIIEELTQAKIVRAVESRRQLEEILVDFWFNHFNVDAEKNEIRYLITSYERDTLRPRIFGKFIDLLRATAKSPAMLVYLDNLVSESPIDYTPGKNGEPKLTPRKKGLNENYARELLELHTMGVDGGYTQEDVTQLARILTGWGVADLKSDPHFEFNERVHDKGAKLFLEQQFAAGQGASEGERALEMLAHHPSTAKFISLKLLHALVSDQPSHQLVDSITQTFIKTDGDLRSVYQAIFNSPEFWSRRSYQTKIKKPFALVVSAIRALGGEANLHSSVPQLLKLLGEDLYRCPPPTGYIERAAAWVNPGALVARLNIALDLTGNRVDGVFVSSLKIPPRVGTTTDLVKNIAAQLMQTPLSSASQNVILRELDSNDLRMSSGEIRPWAIAKVTGLGLGAPEFQRK